MMSTGAKRWFAPLVGVVLVVVILVWLVLLIPVRFLIAADDLGLQWLDTSVATLGQGKVKAVFSDMPSLGIVNLSWRWCPLSGIRVWCVSAESSDMQVSTRVIASTHQLRLKAAEFDVRDPSVLGVPVSLVNARVSGRFEDVRIEDLACPLRSNPYLLGSLRFNQVRLLNNPIEAFSAEFLPGAEVLSVELSGPELSGQFEVRDGGAYNAEGEITPPSNLAPMLESLAIPLGDGRYGWVLEGTVPC